MITELAQLAIQALHAAPSYAMCVGSVSILVPAGLLALAYERSRRRTYQAVLTHIPPGALLVDKVQRRRELIVVRLPQPAAQPAVILLPRDVHRNAD
jgi:hypothetical protein